MNLEHKYLCWLHVLPSCVTREAKLKSKIARWVKDETDLCERAAGRRSIPSPSSGCNAAVTSVVSTIKSKKVSLTLCIL